MKASKRIETATSLLNNTQLAKEPVGVVSQSTGTLGKAMEILDIIANAPEPLRFTQILNILDQPRGTLHRNLSNLLEEKLVEVGSDGSYRPGMRLLTLAARTWSQNSLRNVAEPHIRRLHDTIGETVHLGVISGLEVVYLDKLESRQVVRMHSQVGNSSPLYCTGIGKAILATLSEAEFSKKAAAFDYIRYTPTTLYTATLLSAEIEEIRLARIAHDREEHEPGIRCVAACIGGENSGIFAGLSVTAPAFRICDEELLLWEQNIVITAQNIEHDLAPALGPRHAE